MLLRNLERERNSGFNAHEIFLNHIITWLVFFRILWICVLVGAAIFFVFYISNSLVEYFDYPKTVNVEIEYTERLEFPAVTVCNENLARYAVV